MATRMTGPQKAAILLLSLGEDAAAEVLKNLSEDEIQQVTRHMAQFDQITPQDVDRVTLEFYRVAEKGHLLARPPETKIAYLQKILSRALGEEHGTALVEGLLAAKPAGRLEQLMWHDPGTIADFLQAEHPQVIAVILANLGEPSLMQQVLAEFPESLSQEVFQRLVRLKSISSEWVEEIEASLSEEMIPAAGEPTGRSSPGEQQVAGVLNSAPQRMETALMQHLSQQDPALAERIREEMFPFEDFIKIDNRGIQKILQKSTTQDVVLALHGGEDALRRHFLRNMSATAAAQISAALEAGDPVRVGEIEAARKRLSNVARELDAAGELFVLEKKK